MYKCESGTSWERLRWKGMPVLNIHVPQWGIVSTYSPYIWGFGGRPHLILKSIFLPPWDTSPQLSAVLLPANCMILLWSIGNELTNEIFGRNWSQNLSNFSEFAGRFKLWSPSNVLKQQQNITYVISITMVIESAYQKLIPYMRKKYTRNKFSDLAQIGQVHKI